jgi:hypothetical protein
VCQVWAKQNISKQKHYTKITHVVYQRGTGFLQKTCDRVTKVKRANTPASSRVFPEFSRRTCSNRTKTQEKTSANKQGGNREQKNLERKQRKLELAQRDDTGIVSRLASETNDATYLLTQNDFIVSRVRGSFGRPVISSRSGSCQFWGCLKLETLADIFILIYRYICAI